MDEKSKVVIDTLKAEAVKALQPVAEMELERVKKTVEQSVKKLESYAKKHPEKTTLITAAVGAALGAALSIYLQSEAAGTAVKKKKSKK